MTRKEALAELIEKVEAGKPAKVRIWFGAVGVCYHAASNAAAGSLDSAKALHEAVLPGWGWRVGSCFVSDDAAVFPDFYCPEHGERLRASLDQDREWFDDTDVDRRPPGNPARAWLLAILRALHAKETDT